MPASFSASFWLPTPGGASRPGGGIRRFRFGCFSGIEIQSWRQDALLFESGRADLKDTAAFLLENISPELKAFKGEIVVEGHTDNQPLGSRSKYKSNWELSVARAFSVIQSLTASGVDPEHLSARGYGSYRPRAPNDTAEHRTENRRIEIILLNPPKA